MSLWLSLKELQGRADDLREVKMAQKLTKKQEGFAKDYIETGNATLAVKENYNVSSDNSAAVAGSRLLRNTKVQEYIESKAEKVSEIVFEIAQFGESDNVRLSASKDILDRAGFKPVERIHSINETIVYQPTDRIKNLAKKLNA